MIDFNTDCEFHKMGSDGYPFCASSTEIMKLRNENAKLRKLARGLNWCTENAKIPSAECEHCPLGDTEDGELSCEKLMRELGIEVDK